MDDRSRAVYLKSKYGMTPAEYEELLARQEGLCAICKRLLQHPNIDHNHAIGVIRGILCTSCNGLLGKYGDDSEALRAQADKDEPTYERERSKRADRWIDENPIATVQDAPELAAEKAKRFESAHRRQNGKCVHCERSMILPSIKLLEQDAGNDDSTISPQEPFLRHYRERGDTWLYCSDCRNWAQRAFRLPVSQFFGVSAVPPNILRQAADYLDRPPVHQVRKPH